MPSTSKGSSNLGKKRRSSQLKKAKSVISTFFSSFADDPQDSPEKVEVTPEETLIAGKISRLPFPFVIQRGIFDFITSLQGWLAFIRLNYVSLLLFVAGIAVLFSLIGGAFHLSHYSTNLFVGIETEELDRPGLRFFEEYNNGSRDLPYRHPVLILPGFITTGLEIWEANTTCLRNLNMNPSLRQWMLGPTMILLFLRDPACWLYIFSLDPETGLDRKGSRIRGGEGASSVSEFVPGFWVWEKIIRNLADIGYDQSTLAFATYDWRLSPDLMQKRDGFYHRMRHLILQLYDHHQRRVVVIGHSYANIVLREFLNWVEKEEEGFIGKYISDIINVGGPTLGVAKTLSAVLFGEVQDTLTIPKGFRTVLDKVMEPSMRFNFTRTWSCMFGMLPHTCLDFSDGILESGEGEKWNTEEALILLQEECSRAGYTNCAERVRAHIARFKDQLPSLPAAHNTTMYCLYGIEKPTETGYHVKRENFPGSPDRNELSANLSAPHKGVKLGNGDGTVPLPSLAYMCRAENGWKKSLKKVITMEFTHNTSQASLLDFRGGSSSADHVDILGNHKALEVILRVVSGVDEGSSKSPHHHPPLEDQFFSNVTDVMESDVVKKCRAL